MLVSVSELKQPLSQCVSWAQVIICVLTFIGVIVAIISHCHIIKKNTKAIKANHDLNKKLASMEAINKTLTHNEPFNMRKKYLRYYDSKTPIPLNKLRKDETVRSYLNSLESLVIGVKKNIYDEDTVKEAYKNVITLAAVVFSKYIEYTQNNTHHRDCYEVLQWAAKRWSEKDPDVPVEPSSLEKCDNKI